MAQSEPSHSKACERDGERGDISGAPDRKRGSEGASLSRRCPKGVTGDIHNVRPLGSISPMNFLLDFSHSPDRTAAPALG